MHRDDRKKQLIAQGAIHRAEILLARETIREGLQPGSLAKHGLQYLARAAASMVGNITGDNEPFKALSGFKVQAVLPLMLEVASAIAKKLSWRAVVRGSLIAAVVAGGVALARKMKDKDGPDESSMQYASDDASNLR